MTVALSDYLVVSALLFGVGVYGLVTKRNAMRLVFSVEILVNAANINFIAFSAFLHDLVGQIFAMFVLTVAAAEAAIGLAILVVYYRNRGTIEVEDINLMKG